MRRTTFLGLLLLLSGCNGFGGFLGSTFSTSGDPSQPFAAAENVQRANGAAVTPKPIPVEAGNVWPGPIKPLPSLADIAKTLPEASGVPLLPPVPANPAMPPRTAMPTYAAPPSTVPAPAAEPAPSGSPAPSGPPPTVSPSASSNAPSVKTGTAISTSKGPEIVSGGTGNFLTLTSPNGQYGGIMVPNGNGTSTIIRPDGSVETVKTPH
jgi:hypothetical protein